MRALLEKVVYDIEAYDDSIEQLLGANGQGWGSGEIAWDFRPVRWKAPNGRDVGPVDLLVPRLIEWVHPKHFRPETYTDEPLLILGGDNVRLPYGKFIFHLGEGGGYWERRGFMRACVWYSAAKSWSFADWITFIHRFGIPTPYLQYNGNEAQHDKWQALYRDMLNNLGKGIGAILPKSVDVKTLETPAGGRASDPHSAMVDACNASMAVRILGGTLTTRAGNSGSYALGDVHATMQHGRELADARKFASTAKRDLHEPFFWFNRFAIARAIGERPEDILDAVPEMRFRIAKETSPTERAEIVSSAINDWGLEVDEEALRDEFDLDGPRPGSRPAPGKPQQVSKGGGLVGSVEASRDGAEAPAEPALGAAAPTETAAPESTPPAGPPGARQP
jgi:phage gp29-like protein